MFTQEQLKEVVAYNPETGIFTRLVASGYRGCYKAGNEIGSPNALGYIETTLLGKRVALHRLAWFYMTGEWPKGHIDHLDGNRGRNVWLNLRDVTRKVNQQNMRKATRASNTGMLGASLDRLTGKYVARIRHEGKYLNLGRFDTAEEAHAAYVEAKRRLHEGNTL